MDASETNDERTIDYSKETHFQTLTEIPIMSVSDLKKSPMVAFDKASENETGVYVTNHGKVVGVVLTQHQYEILVNKLDALSEQVQHLID